MSIKILTVVGLNVAVALDKEIVQIFKRDFTKTFFMLKEDYIADKADPGSSLNLIGIGAVPKLFDNQAYSKFTRDQFVRYGAPRWFGGMRMLIVEYIERMYKGIQIVEKHEDVSPDFYTYELSASDKGNKFQPEHFLIGTQITVSPTIGQMYRNHLYPSIFTVQGIRANGPNSFVLVTTTDDLSGILPGEKYSFNISHVENIVSQGKGTIKINSWKNIDYQRILSFEDASKSYPKYAKKNHWLSYGDGSQLAVALAIKHGIPRGCVVDAEGLMNLLMCQSFVKKIDTGNVYLYNPRLWLMNKKRAKEFVKKNLHRFLSSAKQAQKEYDDEMEKYYYDEAERAMARDWDGRDVDYGDDYSPFDELLNRSSIFDADDSSFED